MLITLIRLLHIWPQIQANLSAHLDQTIPHSVFQLFILFFCILMLDVDSHDRPPAIPCRRECTKAPLAAEIFASIYSELHPLPAPSSRHRPLPHPRPHPTIRRGSLKMLRHRLPCEVRTARNYWGQRYLFDLPRARNLSGGVIAMSDIFYN